MVKLKALSWFGKLLNLAGVGFGLFRGGRTSGCGKYSGSRNARERQDPRPADALAVIISTTEEPVPDRSDKNQPFVRFCRIRLLTGEEETSHTTHWLELDQKSRHRK